jgi:uncharacterized protein YceK
VKAKPAALILVAVLAAGCTSAKAHVSATVTHSPSTAVTKPPTAADKQLATSLVQASDLPAGYIKDAQTRGTALAVSTTDSACAHRFGGASRLQTTGALAPTAQARSSFSKGSSPTFIRAAAFRYHDAQAATKIVTAVHDVLAGCRSFTATNPSTKRVVTVALSPLPFPHLGDGGVAVDGTLSESGKHVFIDMVFVRTKASIAYVAALTTGTRDFVALRSAARAEVKRLTSG